MCEYLKPLIKNPEGQVQKKMTLWGGKAYCAGFQAKIAINKNAIYWWLLLDSLEPMAWIEEKQWFSWIDPDYLNGTSFFQLGNFLRV